MATARSINEAIQHERRTALDHGAVLADGTKAGIGDRIATRRNNANLETTTGVTVRNRHTWTVRSAGDDGGLVVTDAERGSVRLPADYVAEHVELGWAVTGYGNQGDTTDIAYAVIEPGTSRSHLYVAMTRGRAANHAWIPDPTGTLDPAEALAEVASRAPSRVSALAMHAQLVQGLCHRPARRDVPDPGRPAPGIELVG